MLQTKLCIVNIWEHSSGLSLSVQLQYDENDNDSDSNCVVVEKKRKYTGAENDNDSDSECVVVEKKRKYTGAFQYKISSCNEWRKIWPFITSVPGLPHEFRCQVCKKSWDVGIWEPWILGIMYHHRNTRPWPNPRLPNQSCLFILQIPYRIRYCICHYECMVT